MKQFLLTASAALLVLAAGCATSTTMQHGSGGQAATCYVCQHNNDLACVCVKVNDHTPRTEYNGQTYYFCSEDCQAAFVKKPQKYLAKP